MSKELQKIKENFKIGNNSTSDINSGLIILIVGIFVLSVPFLFTFNLYGSILPDYHAFLLDEYTNIFTYLFLFPATDPSGILLFGSIGWGFGGFISAILYGKEGQNGPLYASYILFRFFLGLSLVYLLLYINALDFGSIEIFMPFLFMFVIFIFSLPMILVSAVSYRIGLWISPKQ